MADRALAIARQRQVNKPGRGREIIERNKAAKAARAKSGGAT
jgi:bifunctional UDP-N-acetylglucosamine pyrophosphorylase/glucosamine-1-phosphate N-acetyltransferase